jgi:hypothetical protein
VLYRESGKRVESVPASLTLEEKVLNVQGQQYVVFAHLWLHL